MHSTKNVRHVHILKPVQYTNSSSVSMTTETEREFLLNRFLLY